MGYRAEKLKAEKQMRIFKLIMLGILVLCILGLCIFSSIVPIETWEYLVDTPKVSKRKAGELRIHFLDVGQGDATLIELPDDKVMLIDGGDGSDGATKSLMRYLNGLKIEQIDYLVVTHTDGDHCGGLGTVLQQKEVFNAYLPPSFEETNVEYADFYAELLKEKCTIQYSSRAISSLGENTGEYPYTLTFLYPNTIDVEDVLNGNTEIEDDNLFSAILWLDYQGVSAIFMGDASQEIEEKLILEDSLGVFDGRGVDLQSTEILKVGHHGSATATCSSFLQHLHVKDAVISCGADNPYGHPTQETLSRLQDENINVHRTDKNEHIVITIQQDGSYSASYIEK